MPKFPLLADGSEDNDLHLNIINLTFCTFDFSDDRLLRTPVFHIVKYVLLEKLTTKAPDSLIVS